MRSAALLSRDAWLALGVAALAALVRAAFTFRAPVFLEGDSQSYLLPAWDLINGGDFAPELRRAPGYPLFTGLVFAAFGSQLEVLAVVQHGLGVAASVLTYALARRWLSWQTSLIAALLVALSGPIIIYEHYVMSEALFGVLLTGAILVLVTAIQRDRLPLFALAGALLGLAALCRPVAQVLIVLVPLGIAAFLGFNRRGLVAGGVTVTVALLVLAPWALRNLASHGTVSSAGGLGRSLIARTVKYDEGFFNSEHVVRPGESPTDLKPAVRQIVYRKRNNVRKGRSVRPVTDAIVEELGLSPSQADGVMREVALEAIRDQPLYYLEGTAIMAGQILVGKDERLISHWRQRVDKDWDEQWESRLDRLLVGLTTGQQQGFNVADRIVSLFQPARFDVFLPFLALIGVLAAAANRASRVALIPAGTVLILVVVSAALDGPVARYRYPLDPLLAVCSASALALLPQAYSALAVRLGRLGGRGSVAGRTVLDAERPALEANR